MQFLEMMQGARKSCVEQREEAEKAHSSRQMRGENFPFLA
jgi:hypothetical protein